MLKNTDKIHCPKKGCFMYVAACEARCTGKEDCPSLREFRKTSASCEEKQS